eukprot:1136816-Pelagomonas_calceolata.AAC.5
MQQQQQQTKGVGKRGFERGRAQGLSGQSQQQAKGVGGAGPEQVRAQKMSEVRAQKMSEAGPDLPTFC